MTITHRRSGLWPLAALLAFAALASSCIRAEIAIRVNDDGSGTVSVLTAFDRSLMEAFGEDAAAAGAGFDPSVFTEIDEAELPPGASVEPYEDGDFLGTRVTIPFASDADVAASIERAFAAAGGDGGLTGDDGAFRRFVLERDGDGWRFDAEMDPASSELAAGGDDSFGEELAQFLFQDASFVVRLTLPGEIVEHNADETGPQGELVWNIDLLGGEVRTLSATSGAGGDDGGGGGAVIAVAAVALLLAAGVGVALLVRRRRGVAL